MSKAERSSSKVAGERAEGAVIQAVDGLEPVSDQEAEHFDAVPSTAIAPCDAVPFAGIAVLERGVPVEIKSCIPRLSSGERGRFYLREEQHEQLVDDGGVYLFAVVTPHDREPIAMKVAAARSVGDVVPSWIEGGDRPDFGQIALSRVFHPDEVRA
jgi:hypothetical protein